MAVSTRIAFRQATSVAEILPRGGPLHLSENYRGGCANNRVLSESQYPEAVDCRG